LTPQNLAGAWAGSGMPLQSVVTLALVTAVLSNLINICTVLMLLAGLIGWLIMRS
jgi:phage shock protein PspC (stress-responsive transcriptional regulator)